MGYDLFALFFAGLSGAFINSVAGEFSKKLRKAMYENL